VRTQQQPAFVLHHRPYSESSLLLEVFTPDYGRVALIAKGARRPNSRQYGLLKPLQPLSVSWSGRGELALLTGAEANGAGVPLQGEALYCGLYLNELLMRLLHRHDPHAVLYDCYQTSLFTLNSDQAHELTLRIFEKRLLSEIGYGLVLDRDISDNSAIQAKAVYDYILDRGPTRVTHPELNRPIQGVRLRGTTLLALAEDKFTDRIVLRETKRLMRALLAKHLGDRPLHSRRLFNNVTARPQPTTNN
jgi:DNA repair protein RecO (recombination protein O)